MKCSYRIVNGRVIDPKTGVDGVKDVYIKNSRIVAVDNDSPPEVEETIDASGCLVLPGLIDFHTHLYRGHSDLGLHPDLMTIPNGVTAAVDAGSVGTTNFEGWYKDVVGASEITLRTFIHAGPVGIVTEQHHECPDPKVYDVPRHEYMFERYRDHILGLKVRVGQPFTGEFGFTPLVEAKKLARHLKTNVCVHVVQPEGTYEEVFAQLDKGDILCHCFQSKGNDTILDKATGKVKKVAREARERGVIFDGASGRANYSFGVVRAALADGFLPDVISTDVVTFSIYKPKVFALPWVMSAYIALGMPLMEVIRCVTQTPARLMRLEGQIGTLAPGALADLTIMRFEEKPITFRDQFENSVPGKGFLSPLMTIKAGRCLFMRMDFAHEVFPQWR